MYVKYFVRSMGVPGVLVAIQTINRYTTWVNKHNNT